MCLCQLVSVWRREEADLIVLGRVGLARSGGELPRAGGVLPHERHPAGGVRGGGGTSLLWTRGVLQGLRGVPRHPPRPVLLHRETLGEK